MRDLSADTTSNLARTLRRPACSRVPTYRRSTFAIAQPGFAATAIDLLTECRGCCVDGDSSHPAAGTTPRYRQRQRRPVVSLPLLVTTPQRGRLDGSRWRLAVAHQALSVDQFRADRHQGLQPTAHASPAAAGGPCHSRCGPSAIAPPSTEPGHATAANAPTLPWGIRVHANLWCPSPAFCPNRITRRQPQMTASRRPQTLVSKLSQLDARVPVSSPPRRAVSPDPYGSWSWSVS